jgi:hypothetical protein
MILRIAVLLLVLAAPGFAASLNLRCDSASGEPGKFAAEEIRREAAAKGLTLSDDALAPRITITVNEGDEDAIVLPVQDAGLQTYMQTLDIQFARGY